MAGEIIAVSCNKPTIGGQLQIERGFSHADGVMAMMLVILAVGIIVDFAAVLDAGAPGQPAVGVARRQVTGDTPGLRMAFKSRRVRA